MVYSNPANVTQTQLKQSQKYHITVEQSLNSPTRMFPYQISLFNPFFPILLSQVNIHCDKLGHGGRTEGKKDKDIRAQTDSSHIKVPLLCLLVPSPRKQGTKHHKEEGTGRREMISPRNFYFIITGGRVWLSVFVSFTPALSSFPIVHMLSCSHLPYLFPPNHPALFTHSFPIPYSHMFLSSQMSCTNFVFLPHIHAPVSLFLF